MLIVLGSYDFTVVRSGPRGRGGVRRSRCEVRASERDVSVRIGRGMVLWCCSEMVTRRGQVLYRRSSGRRSWSEAAVVMEGNWERDRGSVRGLHRCAGDCLFDVRLRIRAMSWNVTKRIRRWVQQPKIIISGGEAIVQGSGGIVM